MTHFSHQHVNHQPIVWAVPQWQLSSPRQLIKAVARQWRLAAAIVAFVLPLNVAFQLLYPADRALPFAAVAGKSLSFKNRADIHKLLDSAAQQKFLVKAATKSYETSFKELGIQFNANQTAQRLTDYPLRQRLIPFSLLNYGRRQQGERAVMIYNQAQIEAFVSKIAQENTKPPVEGTIYVENGQVKVAAAQAGSTYDTKATAELIAKLGSRPPQNLVLMGTVVEPKYPHAALEKAAQTAQVIGTLPLKITAANYQEELSAGAALGWLTFVPNEATRQIDVVVDRESVKAALKNLASRVYVAPGTVVITSFDGVEVSRTTASPGRALDVDTTATAITDALKASNTVVVAKVVQVPVGQRHNRSYSATSRGLGVLLNDWAAEHGGRRWGIMVIEMDSQGRTAGFREGDQFVTASVYKLFVSYSVQLKIDRGEINPGSGTSAGQTVEGCLELMIVRSSNACGHALGDMVGWNNITAIAQAAGFGSTVLNTSANFYTTAYDTALFMQKLHGGNLLSADQTARLLDRLRRQIYRGGIPAGSQGSAVADKVGYYGGYRHDVAIVYHPHGAYVLSILSYGGTNPQIADLARTISNYMSQ